MAKILIIDSMMGAMAEARSWNVLQQSVEYFSSWKLNRPIRLKFAHT